MRSHIAVMSVLLFLPIPSYPQNNVEVENDLAHHAFYVDFASRGQLDLRIRPAEIHIIGSDEDRVVHSGMLEINGGPRNDVTVTVQVPKESNLIVRVFAGDVEVSNVVGDKDV